MNWKEWLGYNLYKKLWSLTPINRPFTYFLRDVWHKCPFVWTMGLIALGVAMGHNLDWIEVLKWMAIFTAGFIFGHLFWGKKYIPDEKGT